MDKLLAIVIVVAFLVVGVYMATGVNLVAMVAH